MSDSIYPSGSWEDSAWVSLDYFMGLESPCGCSLEQLFDDERIGSLAAAAISWLEIRKGFHRGDMIDLLARKQHDYGCDNVLKFGFDGIRVRMWDKIARIRNLEAKDTAMNESLEDSYTDLLGYCVLYDMYRDDVFTRPLAAEMAPEKQEAPTFPLATPQIVRSDDGPIFYGDKFIIVPTGRCVDPDGNYGGTYAEVKAVRVKSA